MNKKVWMGFIAVFVAMQILDYIVHGVILKPTYDALKSLWRPDEKLWLYPIIGFIVSFFFALIFSKGYENKGVGEGVRFGFYFGMVMSIPMAYGSYAMWPIPYSLALQWFLYTLVEYIILGVVIAKVFGSKPKETAPAA